MDKVWGFLHLFFAFSFVGSLVVAEWNGRAARATTDWSQRALLFRIVSMSSRVAGVGGLVLLGVFGNIWSVNAGYRMATDTWPRLVNGLWLLAVVSMTFLVLPAASRLHGIAASGAGGGATDGLDAALKRWRAGNVLLSVLYLGLLVLMVSHWR